jgi:hypothetical protein
MGRKPYRLFLAALATVCVAGLPSCGHDQRLVSIVVQPPTAFFLTPNTPGSIQLTALGTYIHPPETKDLTHNVTWVSDIPTLVKVDSSGAVTTSGTGACGIANITASITTNNPSGNLIMGSAAVTVHDAAIPVCP